jgi:hypothetical protein
MPIAAEHAFKEKSARSLIPPPLRTTSKRTFQCEIPCSITHKKCQIIMEKIRMLLEFIILICRYIVYGYF